MASRLPVSVRAANRQTSSPVPVTELDALGLAISRELCPGDPCPRCGEEKLDYDGTLNLACPRCGLTQGGCFS